MNDERFPLGRPIPRDVPEPPKKAREQVAPGIFRNSEGKLETDIPTKGPQFPQPETVYIYGGAHWDAVIKGMQQQIADGFPLNEFGVM